ncbi:exosortase A [Alteromonas macleodii]|jgi:exosortase A|uniref:Transmembrane protein EpsH n=2 Tax=root TaxID=1 RepID=A0AB33A1A0_ALTME|nr:exosortase A [Alteromonas macleodii]AFT75394.1 transmembrane protein EpsH [Alteromonas macleodii str. 'English Channel 673']MBL3811338.1 exosortase [Alteromonas macleodii]MBL3884876.1 exosortase [Alteromonas macleodii]
MNIPLFLGYRTILAQFAALIVLWIIFTFKGLSTAVDIWWNNEIFNHGFLIIPVSFYLIWVNRANLRNLTITPSLFPAVVILGLILLYIVGLAGDIRLFLHVATFAMLPVIIWGLVGHHIAKRLLFPLCFILFSIPVGEQLIPYLQQITADGSVFLLKLTNIPNYRTGLYIEIPQGRFLVAEACSGVSFFIASIVMGSAYAYLNFQSGYKRGTFFLFSMVLPIAANIIRVFGIITIAYYTDMEYAAGADHLIYGWFFFAFVLILLLGTGELFREKKTGRTPPKQVHLPVEKRYFPSIVMSSLLLLGFLWGSLLTQSSPLVAPPSLHIASIQNANCASFIWAPEMLNPDQEKQFSLQGTNCKTSVYTAWFSENGNELISDSNRLFNKGRFSVETFDSVKVNEHTFPTIYLTTPNDEKVLVTHWYVINDTLFTSAARAKFYQIALKMAREKSTGRIWVIGTRQSDLRPSLTRLFDAGVIKAD